MKIRKTEDFVKSLEWLPGWLASKLWRRRPIAVEKMLKSASPPQQQHPIASQNRSEGRPLRNYDSGCYETNPAESNGKWLDAICHQINRLHRTKTCWPANTGRRRHLPRISWDSLALIRCSCCEPWRRLQMIRIWLSLQKLFNWFFPFHRCFVFNRTYVL